MHEVEPQTIVLCKDWTAPHNVYNIVLRVAWQQNAHNGAAQWLYEYQAWKNFLLHAYYCRTFDINKMKVKLHDLTSLAVTSS